MQAGWKTSAAHDHHDETVRMMARIRYSTDAGRHWPKSVFPINKNDTGLILRLISVRLQATLYRVKIRSFVNKGLKELYAEDSAKGVRPDTVDKVRKMLAFLDDMQDPEELRALAAWKVHTLTGDRKGTWSLSVTRNRRLTFRIDTVEREIYDLNLEDYH